MYIARLWLQLALLFCASSYAGPIAEPLAVGMVLVATANLHGTSFEKTVILITQYDRQGALGITLNRPAQRNLVEFFPDLNAKAGNRPLFLGGPVYPGALFVLQRTQAPIREGWVPVMESIQFTGGTTAYRFLKDSQPDSPLRVFAGYAGWGSGQLENEIQRGDWLATAINPEMIFSAEPERTWERLNRLNSGKWI